MNGRNSAPRRRRESRSDSEAGRSTKRTVDLLLTNRAPTFRFPSGLSRAVFLVDQRDALARGDRASALRTNRVSRRAAVESRCNTMRSPPVWRPRTRVWRGSGARVDTYQPHVDRRSASSTLRRITRGDGCCSWLGVASCPPTSPRGSLLGGTGLLVLLPVSWGSSGDCYLAVREASTASSDAAPSSASSAAIRKQTQTRGPLGLRMQKYVPPCSYDVGGVTPPLPHPSHSARA